MALKNCFALIFFKDTGGTHSEAENKYGGLMMEGWKEEEHKDKIIDNVTEPWTPGFLFSEQVVGSWFNSFSFAYSLPCSSVHWAFTSVLSAAELGKKSCGASNMATR